jgi:hypothetical protein
MRGFLLALFSTCLFLAPTVIAISMSSHPLQRSGDAYGRRLAFITKERPSIRVFGIRELWARNHLEWDDVGKACFEALQAEGDTGPDWNHTWSERDAVHVPVNPRKGTGSLCVIPRGVNFCF